MVTCLCISVLRWFALCLFVYPFRCGLFWSAKYNDALEEKQKCILSSNWLLI